MVARIAVGGRPGVRRCIEANATITTIHRGPAPVTGL
jgi:hypothetical protein